MLLRIPIHVPIFPIGSTLLLGALLGSPSIARQGESPSAIAPAGLDAASETEQIAQEFKARFGVPTSNTFAALNGTTREAVERYFVRGRGAMPRSGIVDSAVAHVGNGSAGGAGNAQTTTPIFMYGDPIPGYPGLFNVMLGNTGTGYAEAFLLQIPDGTPTSPRPLLVVFHKYGVSHADALFNTNFVQECRNRGWYMLAPYGAIDDNFGCIPSQINTNVAIDWVRASAPIDLAHVYGVGFSMGGGGCASYAARHLDPTGAMFAAIVNHTGTVSLAHAYANEGTIVQVLLEGLFGGSPAAQPFAYQRCSTVDIDHLTNMVGIGTDMSRNLTYVHSWLADQDPQPYLPEQTQIFQTHVHALEPADVLTVVPGNVHSWSTLDDTAACDWLATFTLEEPNIGTTLADDNGAWHRFRINQDAQGAFTPFSWYADANANRLSLWATANLERISVDAAPMGLLYSGTLKLNMSSADGTGDQVLFLHVQSPPTSVLRNNVPANGTYNPQGHSLLIDETSGSGAQWVIHF